MIYNQRFKNQFLDNLESASVAPVYSALFNKSREIEEQLNKDLFNFIPQDIDLLYYSISTPSLKTLEVFHSLLVKYANYAISQGQRDSNVNLYSLMSFKELQKYVATYKHQYLTKKEFDEFMEFVANETDVAAYRALFEGISGSKYSEIVNLKHSDVFEKGGKYYVDLCEDKATGGTEERTIEITPRLHRDLEKAYKQELYLGSNGEAETQTNIEIVDSPFIFRPLKRGAYQQSEGKINMQTIYRKKILLNELTDGRIKNTNTILLSGMLHYASQIHQEKDELSSQDYLDIAERYNKQIASKYQSQKIKHVQGILRDGLKERYDIEI